MGTAEIDLAPLLWSSGGSGGSGAGPDEEQQLQQRSVSGSYPLLDGAAASQGGASLTARVQLQLLPLTGATQQADTAAAAGADAAAGAWELERAAASNGQRLVQPLRQAGIEVEGSSSDRQSGQQPQQLAQRRHKVLSTPSADSDSEEDDVGEELLERCRRLSEAAAAAAGATAAVAPSSSSGRVSHIQQQGQEQQQQQQQQADADSEQQQAGDISSPPRGASASQGDHPQQGQPGVLSEGSPAGGGFAGAATQVQQVRQGALPEAAEAGQLLVRVETALHLPAAAGGTHAYVQAVWGVQRQHQQRTAAVPVHVVAAADLGGTAVWNADLALPAAAASWASNSSSSGGSSSSGPVLLLKVWSTAAAEGSTAGAASVSDALIGCAVVDLSVLPLLREQQGWWHIVGSGEQQQGQLKASVRPDSVLLEQLCSQAVAAVSGSAHSIASPPAAAALEAWSPPQQQHLQRQEQHDLVQQLQAQLQVLELLSQRLAAEPPAAAPAAAAAATTTPAAVLAAAEELPASDDEGLSPFDARQVCAAYPPSFPPFCSCQQPHLGCTVRTSCASEPPYVGDCVRGYPCPVSPPPSAVWLRLERQRQRRRRRPSRAAGGGL